MEDGWVISSCVRRYFANSPFGLRKWFWPFFMSLKMMLECESHTTSQNKHFFTTACLRDTTFTHPEEDRIIGSEEEPLVLFTTQISVFLFCMTLYGKVNSLVCPSLWYSYSRITSPLNLTCLISRLLCVYTWYFSDSLNVTRNSNLFSTCQENMDCSVLFDKSHKVSMEKYKIILIDVGIGTSIIAPREMQLIDLFKKSVKRTLPLFIRHMHFLCYFFPKLYFLDLLLYRPLVWRQTFLCRFLSKHLWVYFHIDMSLFL